MIQYENLYYKKKKIAIQGKEPIKVKLLKSGLFFNCVGNDVSYDIDVGYDIEIMI